jgi:hypothetical protein
MSMNPKQARYASIYFPIFWKTLVTPIVQANIPRVVSPPAPWTVVPRQAGRPGQGISKCTPSLSFFKRRKRPLGRFLFR